MSLRPRGGLPAAPRPAEATRVPSFSAQPKAQASSVTASSPPRPPHAQELRELPTQQSTGLGPAPLCMVPPGTGEPRVPMRLDSEEPSRQGFPALGPSAQGKGSCARRTNGERTSQRHSAFMQQAVGSGVTPEHGLGASTQARKGAGPLWAQLCWEEPARPR